MWYEEAAAQKAYQLFIEPKFCLMTKDEVKEHVAEYNDTHDDQYRYYSIPQLWQRTRPDGNEESISGIDRFMKNYYMHYDKFSLEYTHADDVEDNESIVKYLDTSIKALFKKQYYDLINFIKDELGARINRIAIHQDDEGADRVTIDINLDDEIHTIIMKRVDAV